MSAVLLEARNVTKRYGGSLALNDASVTLYSNAVNVLIGENGAGKSTLMRILSGVERCDSGNLLLNGLPVRIRSPREAAQHGISIVHQELSILPNLDVSENIFAGRELTKALVVDRRAEDRLSGSALERLRNTIDVHTEAAHLSLGARQIVELARTLAHGARLLILDEPTSALSVAETEILFDVIADLKQAGVTIVYISHRLHELMHLGDYFTVLRSGKVVGQGKRGEVTRQWIVERMSGRAHLTFDTARQSVRPECEIVLAVRHLTLEASSSGQEAQAALSDVTFDLWHGEILGIYGLLGAGRTELLELLAGARQATGGQVLFQGKVLRPGSVSKTIQAGIALVPEDRQRDGLIPELSVRENIALACTSGPLLARSAEAARVQQLVKDLNIATFDIELPVSSLSGGNQQKVLIARCLMRNPSVLLLDEPTRGVDAGAKAEIYEVLRKLSRNGLSILFTSSEIEETQALADRVLVLCQGKVSAQFNMDEVTDQALFTAASPTISSGSLV